MIKRMVIAAMVLALAMSVAVPVAMAGALEEQRPQVFWQIPWYYRWQPFPVWPGWGYRPAPSTGLEYHYWYVSSKNQLVLYVVNPTDEPITVTTPTTQKVDFVLWQNGEMVWRSSVGKAFAQVVTKETFEPNEGKIYRETLPWLPTGLYFTQAYFLGETKWVPVASTYIWLQAYEPLQYTVEYLRPGWFNPMPRLRVVIKNVSDHDITLPYQYGYQVLVKKVGAKDYLPNVGMGQSIGTIEKGATRYVFVYLNGLEPGLYQADVRSNLASGSYSIVAQTWFYVW